MKKVSFTFLMKPISKDNYKSSVPIKKNGKFICVPRLADYYKQYEIALAEDAENQMLNQGVATIGKTKQIWVTKLNLFFDREPTTSDFFNFGKSLFDSLNGVVYEDDSQIIGFMGVGKKMKDKESPRIELELSWEE